MNPGPEIPQWKPPPVPHLPTLQSPMSPNSPVADTACPTSPISCYEEPVETESPAFHCDTCGHDFLVLFGSNPRNVAIVSKFPFFLLDWLHVCAACQVSLGTNFDN